MMSRCSIKVLVVAVALGLTSAVQFSCEKSAFIFADSDPQSQEEFSARNPAAGGIIVTHLNNQTTTYHFDNTTMTWMKDSEPQIQCQLEIITDTQMPNCLNISGMPYCETPLNVVQEIRKNMTETPPTPERMPIWVDKVCQSPNSAYVRIMFGQFGSHFLAAYENTQQLQNSSEYSQNITQTVNNFLTKKTCEGGQANATTPSDESGAPPSPGAGNMTMPSAPGQPPSGPGSSP